MHLTKTLVCYSLLDLIKFSACNNLTVLIVNGNITARVWSMVIGTQVTACSNIVALTETNAPEKHKSFVFSVCVCVCANVT